MALPIARFAGLTYSNHDIHPPPIPNPAPAGYSANVFINGLPAHSTGNTCIPHTIPIIPPPPPHPDVLISGHATVRINGGCAATIGSATNFGALVQGQYSHTVFMGDAPLLTAIVSESGEVTQPPPPPPPVA
jgi:uncharacterized Zn-binding protein involved in type VI secretion